MSEKTAATSAPVARRRLREALELIEDRALAEFASERERTFRMGDALSHEKAWKAPSRRARGPRRGPR
jgi:hypothetical protein